MKNAPTRLFIMLALALCAGFAHGQTESDDKNIPKDTKKQSEYYKHKREQDKKVAEATKAALKHQRDIQTPEVRKRMKKDAREAKRYNEHKREFFLKGWFRKKEPRGKPNPQTGQPPPN